VAESESPTKRVLRALRRPRDEAQLTQLIAAFAGTDPRFAAELARILIARAPQREAVEALGSIPDHLDCGAESHLFDVVGAGQGFVDLRFADEPEDFTLLVELKLHSEYGAQQLERYLAGLRALPAGHSALLAVTRNLPRYGEDEVRRDPRWLGSVRWAHVFDALRALEHRDPVLRPLWGELLNLIREQGDFGLMDFDPKAVEAWARWREGREILIRLLEEIYEPALETIRAELARVRGVELSDDLATPILHKGKRLVWPWGESLNLQFAIPAGNGERLRVQFVGGHGEPFFTAEARHEDDHILSAGQPALLETTRKLKALGFATGHSWGSYWARPHGPQEWLYEGSRISEAILELVKRDVRDLAESGIFEALPAAAPGAPNAPPEEPVEDVAVQPGDDL
jgi:hypothetical protein